MNRYEMIKFFTDTLPPVNPERIARLEKRLSLIIPDAHKEFLALYNGANTNYGVLYGIDDIEEMYEANHLAQCTPGYVCIGGDNGDYEFLMEAKADAQAVYVIDAGALNIEDIRAGRVYTMTFIFDWLLCGNGEDPGDPMALFEEEDEALALVDIELVKLPSGGSAELYKLLGDLGLAVSPKIVMEYQKSQLPCTIGKNQYLHEIEPKLSKLKDQDVVRMIHIT